jgi:hypothetical protein
MIFFRYISVNTLHERDDNDDDDDDNCNSSVLFQITGIITVQMEVNSVLGRFTSKKNLNFRE